MSDTVKITVSQGEEVVLEATKDSLKVEWSKIPYEELNLLWQQVGRTLRVERQRAYYRKGGESC
ncbi:hypothetical protein [Runella salmonicolor]|uniref:KTSC domain-containing protein n=1 Tax=Runella salmonicolor TaxID=2950278 RepID=A0ABT1FVM8_9BACT|nr:hypothetical protein [Runella salmonicolor]MCP1384823.1 hypothetical protein [Runella salmonicolor]